MDRSVLVVAALLGAAPGCAAPGSAGSVGSGSSNGGPDLLAGFDGGGVAATSIAAVIRDFRLSNALDPTTDPDFEDPPYGIAPNGQASPGYLGPWDDPGIVADTLGPDGKPVYRNATGQTMTTHGRAAFDAWYRDVPGENWHVDYALPLVEVGGGQVQYDSEQQGVPYGPDVPDQGRGFFPIDDGGPYATPFGNQGEPHNYSFTVEIHAIFTYRGGETFSFRGDDDVFVFIDGRLVIDLGGVHGPEQRQVSVDSLGLRIGQEYPLDFFSAERHVTGSNIEFQTTLALRSRPAQ